MNQVLEKMLAYNQVERLKLWFPQDWYEDGKQSQIIGDHYTFVTLNEEQGRMAVHE
jgi:hypothetical protein